METKKIKSFIYEGKEIDFPFPIEAEIIEGRVDNSQVLKTLVEAYNKQKEDILELMDIIDDLKADLGDEIECYDKNCSTCSYRDHYLGKDDKIHYEDTCIIKKARNKIKDLEEKGYNPWK